MHTVSDARVSVIIPTKNRAHDLELTIESLQVQSRLPDELVLVDQTPAKSFVKPSTIPIKYIHDPNIQGAAEARNVGMSAATGDIWLFLDDDVILEPEFIEELLAAYSPDVVGVSGNITNYTRPAFGRLLWDTIFLRGPFHDVRQRVYRNLAKASNVKPVRVRQFGAGLMSFRASAIRGIQFDVKNVGASPGEDLEFCAQIPNGSLLLITPKARLFHKKSPQARTSEHWLTLHAQVQYYLRQRHWRYGIWNNACFIWLRIGYILASSVSCIRRQSLESWRAWRCGAKKGTALGLKY